MSEIRALDMARPWQGVPSQRPTMRPARRHRLIGVLRIVLPLLALLLIALVVAWPQIMPGPVGISVPTFVPGDGDQPDMLRMDSPRYVGKDGSDRPYEVVARSASLDPLRANIVHLERPSADIAGGGQRDVHVNADKGTYDRDAEQLALDGGIDLTTSDGYRFVTPSASVDLTKGQVRGREQIDGVGPTGTLSANRFEIQESGDVLRFDGRVRVTIQPQTKGDAASEEPVVAQPQRETSS